MRIEAGDRKAASGNSGQPPRALEIAGLVRMRT
jgi:hypothetical protein